MTTVGDEAATAPRDEAPEAREGRAVAIDRAQRAARGDHQVTPAGTDDDDALARYVELC